MSIDLFDGLQKDKIIESIALSDTGSSLGFVSLPLVKKASLQPAGHWSGCISTLYEETNINVNFYRIYLDLEDGTKKLLLALECDKIGSRTPFPPNMHFQLSQLFRIPPELLFNSQGDIGILLGQDCNKVLLEKIKYVNDESTASFLPDFCEDISIYTSPASRYVTIAGSIGSGDLTSVNNKCFFTNINPSHYNGHFHFYNNASDQDMDLAQKYSCNFSVIRQQPVKTIFAPCKLLHQRHCDDDPDNSHSFSAQPFSEKWSSYNRRASPNNEAPQSSGQCVDKPDHTSLSKLSKWFVSVNKNYILPGLMIDTACKLSSFPQALFVLTMIFSLARVPATNTTSCVANVNFASFNNWFTDGCTQSNFPDISGREKFKENLMKYWNNENKKSLYVPSNHLNKAKYDNFSLLGFVIKRKNRLYSRLLYLKKAIYFVKNLNNEPLIWSFFDPTNSIIEDEDPTSEFLMAAALCKDCWKTSKACQNCKWLNSPISMKEQRDLQLIRENLSVLPDPLTGKNFIRLDFPFLVDVHKTHKPEFSNQRAAKMATVTLFKRLRKENLIQTFHDEMVKSFELGHLEILSKQEAEDVLKSTHSFANLNYALKTDSISHPCRPVCNSSAFHKSGSTNSICAQGPKLLNDLKQLFTKFRLHIYSIICDLSRAYRSIRCTKLSGNMRLHFYPSDPHDPDSLMLIIRYLVVTYGDVVASACLEIILREILAPKTKYSISKQTLCDGRFVDDLNILGNDIPTLINGLLDIVQTLEDHGFSLKMAVANFPLPHPFDKEDNDLVTVFKHQWFKKNDLLFNPITLNPSKKKRGAYTGKPLKDLTDQEIRSLQLTKTVLSRIQGQFYSLTGSFFAPILANFKIIFTQACNLSKEWKTVIKDAEFNKMVAELLIKIKNTGDNLQGFPRLLIPINHFPAILDISTDGGNLLASFTIHLSSIKISDFKQKSIISMDAGNKVKHHSIPLIEMCGAVLGVQSTADIIINHPYILEGSLQQNKIFKIRHAMDSKCSLFSLHPNNTAKNVLIKNATRLIHSLWMFITKHNPNILIQVYYLDSASNPSDICSKWQPDPIRSCNSNLWRQGCSKWMDPLFPSPNDVFIEVRHGTITWTGPSYIPSNQCTCGKTLCSTQNGPPCFCHVCTIDDMQNINQAKYITSNLSTFTTNHIEKNVIEFKFLLDNLIDFPSNIHENWLSKRNLPSVIRSLSRILTTTASDNLLGYLGVTKNWAKQHREIETKARDLFFVHEIPPLLQKLIFLSICRESQQMYPPKNLKSYNPITYNGLTMVKTRYTVEAFQTIFNTFVLPLISAHDQLLLYRSFLYAHIRKVPKTENKLGIIHLPINLTLQCLKSGPIGLISPGLRKKVSSWINDLCAHCINHLNLGRAFPHTLGDPRILSLLGQSAAFFHCCSMDTLGPFHIRNTPTSRRGTYPLYCLICVDLSSGFLSPHLIHSTKKQDIILGLRDLALKFRMPRVIISDALPSFRFLASEELFQALNSLSISLIPVQACHQFLNFAERQIQEFKKLMKSFSEDKNQSIFNQPIDLLQLNYRLRKVEHLLSLRPILSTTSDDRAVFLTPRLLSQPFLDNSTLESQIQNIINDHFNPGYIQDLLVYNSTMQKSFQEALLTYLQSAALAYEDPRILGPFKPRHSEKFLKPQINDIVLYMDSKEKSRFGKIVNIKSDTLVNLFCLQFNKLVAQDFHIRTLRLLHRPAEWNQKTGVPL